MDRWLHSLSLVTGSALLIAHSSPAAAQEASTSDELVPIGRGRISAVYDIDVAPPYAFALERELLHVLDVRDPSNVREVAQLPFDGPRVRSVLKGSYLYLYGFGEPIGVIDVSTPTEPRWLGEAPGSASVGMEIVGQMAYLIHNSGAPETLKLGVFELDAATGLPRGILSLDLGVRVRGEYGGITHEDGKLYILVRPANAPRNEIIVVSVVQPRAPNIERRVALPDSMAFNDIAVRGDTGYLLTRPPRDGLAVFQLGPSQAALLGSVSDTSLWFGIDLIVRDRVVYATFKGSGPHLVAFDVADPRHPRLVYSYAIDDQYAAGLGMSLVDNRLYVSGDGGPAPIFDISDPRAPQFIGQWQFEGGWASDIVLNDQLAVITNRWGSGILLYDVTDPTAPKRLVRRLGPGLPLYGTRAAVLGSRVLVTYRDSFPAEVLDVSSLTAPRVTTRFRTPEGVEVSALTPTHAVLGYSSGGLGVIDLANPSITESPVDLEFETRVTDLALHGDLVVIVHADGGLTRVDIGDPAHPVVTGRIRGDSTAYSFPDWQPRSTRVALSPDAQMAFVVYADLGPDERLRKGLVRLTTVDVGASDGPRVLGSVTFACDDADQFPVWGSTEEVLVGVGTELIRIDVTDARRPVVIARYRLKQTMALEGMAVQRGHVFVTAAEDGLLVYKLPPRR